MPKDIRTYIPDNLEEFRLKALSYACQFTHVFYTNHNNIPYPFDPVEQFLAFDILDTVKFSTNDSFEDLKLYMEQQPRWLFGHLSYDLKNQTEKLSSNNIDSVGFPEASFFSPKSLLKFSEEGVEFLLTEDTEFLIREINRTPINFNSEISLDQVHCNTDQTEYLDTVKKLKDHIIEGDIYELNYCVEFIIKELKINPASFFSDLISVSPSPFSSFYKIDQHFLISASPERYLKKTGNKLISQPIKGTARRGATLEEDKKIIETLRNDEKELAENMMIVDLVRNDLARSCIPGSVTVEEMFGIYTFTHLHQMISSISGTLKDDVHFIDAIRNSFPMGSMTGAPKIRVMELIEKYEKSKRGLYSGTLGYFTPQGDFDFNVVIRSLIYNQEKRIGSFQVGSAITYDSDPELEYKECLLKASAIRTLLEKGF